MYFLKWELKLSLFINFYFFRIIDNWISDQMKEIWINLELYIKSYEFSIFRDFSQIFLNFSKLILIFND